jgi:hypothetical protein
MIKNTERQRKEAWIELCRALFEHGSPTHCNNGYLFETGNYTVRLRTPYNVKEHTCYIRRNNDRNLDWPEGEELVDVEAGLATVLRQCWASTKSIREDASFDAYFNGNDVICVTQMYASMSPFPVERIAEMGKGERILIKRPVLRAMGALHRISSIYGRKPQVLFGIPDGENLVVVMKDACESSDAYELRLEQPIVFAPWIDFREPLLALGSDIDIIAKPNRGSFDLALAKARTIGEQKGRTQIAEVIVDGQEMVVAPLREQEVEDAFPRVFEERDPIKVKMVSVSAMGTQTARQFVYGDWIREVADLCEGTLRVGISSQPGSPIVLWGDGPQRFAVLTAKEA